MSDNNTAAGNGVEDDLKRKLVLRVAFAGVLIALLLGALAFIDYLGAPVEEPVASGPTFTAPVPVAKKEVTQPLKPAEPVPAVPAPEAARPVEAPPAPVVETPARPEVAAQPALPPAEPRPLATTKPTAKAVVTPPEGTSASGQFFPPPEKAAAAARPAAEAAPAAAPPAPVQQPPTPPRLFSGYAVQAGVFADAQRAEELRAKLTLNGIPSTMEARVQVGPFKTREEAADAQQKLKALGIDGVLLPPRNARR